MNIGLSFVQFIDSDLSRMQVVVNCKMQMCCQNREFFGETKKMEYESWLHKHSSVLSINETDGPEQD